MEGRAFASTTELTNEIRDRRIGCVELLDLYLARAERHNPSLNAIVVWQVDQARERARAADAALARGERWGPLHGIPMTVKESFNVTGLPSTFGNLLWKDNIAADNAFLIDRLLQAGAIVFGKTNVPYMLVDAFTAPPITHGMRRVHPAAHRAARQRRSPPGCRPSVPAATSPARCATRRITAASMATNRPGG
jgi:Asp-tRNA(Asn)/Glu-tRNA(Gln) amidotransferase A subunit family amidase